MVPKEFNLATVSSSVSNLHLNALQSLLLKEISLQQNCNEKPILRLFVCMEGHGGAISTSTNAFRC